MTAASPMSPPAPTPPRADDNPGGWPTGIVIGRRRAQSHARRSFVMRIACPPRRHTGHGLRRAARGGPDPAIAAQRAGPRPERCARPAPHCAPKLIQAQQSPSLAPGAGLPWLDQDQASVGLGDPPVRTEVHDSATRTCNGSVLQRCRGVDGRPRAVHRVERGRHRLGGPKGTLHTPSLTAGMHSSSVGLGSAAPVRALRMQPFSRDLVPVGGCHPRTTAVPVL